MDRYGVTEETEGLRLSRIKKRRNVSFILRDKVKQTDDLSGWRSAGSDAMTNALSASIYLSPGHSSGCMSHGSAPLIRYMLEHQ